MRKTNLSSIGKKIFGGKKMERRIGSKFGSMGTIIMFLVSMLAAVVNVPIVAATLGDGVVLSYKPNVVSTGETLIGDDVLKLQLKNDATDDNCIDEIIIMPPDTWGGTAKLEKYDRSGIKSETNEETNDNINLVGDSQSLRIVPDHSLCPGETVNIEISGLVAPSSYEVSTIIIKTSDLTHNDIGGSKTWETIGPEALPKIYVTKATGLKLEYLHISSFSSTGFTGTAWGASAKLSKLYVKGQGGASIEVQILTNNGYHTIYSGVLTGGIDTLTMNYAGWVPATMDTADLQSGYIRDGASATYKINTPSATLELKGEKEEIRNDPKYLASGLLDAVGTIITAGNNAVKRQIVVQTVDSSGYDVNNEQIPIQAMTDLGTVVTPIPYMTDTSGNAYFTLQPDCDFGVANVVISTDPLSITPSVTEKVGINAGPAVSYAVTKGKGVNVPAGETQAIEVTLKDGCGNVITNTNQVLVKFDYVSNDCGAKNKLAQSPGGESHQHEEEYTNMGLAEVYLKTDCQLCTHQVQITGDAPIGAGETISLYGVSSGPAKMKVTINEDEIAADQCVDALIEVTDSCGNLVSEIPSEVGDHIEQWESIVRVTIEDALVVNQPGWASSSQTYIADSDFREEYIYNGGSNPYVQGKLNSGVGHVQICGCQGLGVFSVNATSDTLIPGNDEVSVINAYWDCIETEIEDEQLLVCEKQSTLTVAVKDVCGNYMRNQECGTGEANYCVDVKLDGSCMEPPINDGAHLSTDSVCVNVGTGGPGKLEFPIDLYRDTDECCQVYVEASKGVGCCGPYPNLGMCDEARIVFHGAPSYMTTQFYQTRKICEKVCPRDCQCHEENGLQCHEQLHDPIQDMGTEVVSEEVLDLFTVYDKCGHIVKDYDGTIDVKKENEDCASIYQVDHPLEVEGGWCEGTVACEDLTQFGEEKCLESFCKWAQTDRGCEGDLVCRDIDNENDCEGVGCDWTVSGCIDDPAHLDCEDLTGSQCEHYLNAGCSTVPVYSCVGELLGKCEEYTKEQCEMVHEATKREYEDIHVTGNVEAYITKSWECGEDVSWDYEIISENVPHGVYGIGLVISDDKVTPDFQVWYAEAGNIPAGYTEKDWYYQPYPWSSPAVRCTGGVCPNGITVTPKTPQEKNFHISMPIGLLGGCGSTFYWATQLRTNLIQWYGSYDWGGSASGFVGNPLVVNTCDWVNQCDFQGKEVIKKLVIHNCAEETEKQWLNLELDDIMVDKLAFEISLEEDPINFWVYVYLESEETPGFQWWEDEKVGKAPVNYGGAPTIIELEDVDYYVGYLASWYSRGWYRDDQREGGVLIRAGDSKDFYILLAESYRGGGIQIPCGEYSAKFLYYQDYTSADYTEYGCGHPDPDGDGIINVLHCNGQVRDGCIGSDNFNWMDRGYSCCSASCGGGTKDARNDDYMCFKREYAPTPDYGFGDVFINDLKFDAGQAWTKQRDLTAETIEDHVLDVQVSGAICSYEGIVLSDIRPNPETITFIPQPATQIELINHDADTMSYQGVNPRKEACCSDTECDWSDDSYLLNIQVTDGFKNPVNKRDIEVRMDYCLKWPFGTADVFEPMIKHFCYKHEYCREGWCDIEECERLYMEEDHCYTREEFKEFLMGTYLFGDYMGDAMFGDFFGQEIRDWIDSYFMNAQVTFWRYDGFNWVPLADNKVVTDSNGRAQVRVTAATNGLFQIFAIPTALDADYVYAEFTSSIPYELDIAAIPAFGVPADGEQEAMLLIRALDECGNLVNEAWGDDIGQVTVTAIGSKHGENQVKISEDFDGKNNYDNSVTGTLNYNSCLGNTMLRVLDDIPENVTITASSTKTQIGDDTTIAFQGAPVKLAITEITPSDRIPADGQTGAWVTIQVQDVNGNRVTGYLGGGYSGDPGDPWGMADYMFDNICIDLDDVEADHPGEWGTIPLWFMAIDDYTFGWFDLRGRSSWYCGDLLFGEGKIYVTLDNPDCSHGGTVQVKVWDKEQYQCQEINENGIPSSVKSTQCLPDTGEIDFVDPADRWDIKSNKQIILANGQDNAKITLQVRNPYMAVRQAVDANVFVGGEAEDGAVLTWNGASDKHNPTSMRVTTDPVSGRATLELSSTEPGIAEVTVVGGDAYVCAGMSTEKCMEKCMGYKMYYGMGYKWFEHCEETCSGLYQCPGPECKNPLFWYFDCWYSHIEDLTPKTIQVEFIEVADNELYLNVGWNFISTPYALDASGNEIGEIFDVGKIIAAYGWDATAQNWVVLTPTSVLQPLKGYWLKMSSEDIGTLNYRIDNFPVIPTQDVKPGWNAVGLTSSSPVIAENALMSIDPSYSLLIDWNEAAQKYNLPVANTGENGGGSDPMKTGGFKMEPKQGYWIWVRTADKLAGLSAYSG